MREMARLIAHLRQVQGHLRQHYPHYLAVMRCLAEVMRFESRITELVKQTGMDGECRGA